MIRPVHTRIPNLRSSASTIDRMTSSATEIYESKLKASKVTSCEASDALIKLGVKHGGFLGADIKLLSPEEDAVICGPAYTVQMVPITDSESLKPSDHFVDAARQGCIVVISAPEKTPNAVWGGLMTAGAQVRGALGVVIDGRCRDLKQHREAGFPVFAHGTSTLGQGGFTRPSALDVLIRMGSLGVAVKPEDMIVGDVDGVVCIPRELLQEVVALCEKGRETDDRVLSDIREGKGVATSMAMHRGKK